MLMTILQQETIQCLRRGFPALSEYPDERIEFLVPNNVDSTATPTWARVLEEAWEGFEEIPPKQILFQISDGPGDSDASE